MPRSSWLLLAPLAAIAAGCSPACEATCHKLLDCDVSPRLSQEECEQSCETQQHLYEAWEDETKQQAFDDQRGCIRESSCEEILDGVCYEEEIWVF